MGFTLTKAWIVLYRLHDGVSYQYFTTQKEFEDFLELLDKRGAEDVCCLVPTDFYLPYHVEELE